jgi:hypothetical protein
MGLDAIEPMGLEAIGLDALEPIGLDTLEPLGLAVLEAMGLDAMEPLGLDAMEPLGLAVLGALGLDAMELLGCAVVNALGLATLDPTEPLDPTELLVMGGGGATVARCKTPPMMTRLGGSCATGDTGSCTNDAIGYIGTIACVGAIGCI